ncbi:MAG TPA: D-alanyl-D-alanine carboxypeptidase [Candidatus Fimadaptatus faecigallinarum]|uniref:D-alanyl-D-alanine carboxypeptidase n=1 Tax=Candidatus Fimadaptatus faecigallinarum TaxID=2840814 RepID=A0A9D1S483_9FIRM|nr:D-alanyl-D-alanine carboxypeptidase [Candidatus Fimadaptatus faecigallinarum]
MASSQTRTRVLAVLLALLLMLANAATALAYDSDHPEVLTDSDLVAASAILIDGHTGRVLYQKDPDTVRYPASTTKIMTLLLALENVDDLDATITIPKEANQYPEGSSLVGLYTGEEMTWRTLLNVFFICSGNDAGIAIAVLIAGSEEAFADMMNERAQEIGCTNTHFTNPHGFHDPDHYTTARDLAMIALEAMKNPEFRTIASTTNYTIPANNKRSEATTKWTKNQFIARNDPAMQYKYVYGTGIKTGYTSKAGQTFVGSATRDGVDLISVVLLSSTDGKWIDSIRLMEYGFATYKSYDPVALYNQSPLDVSVSDFASDDPSGGLVRLNISSSYTDPICATSEEIEAINSGFASMLSTNFTRELKAPVSEGEVMGTLTYTAPSGDKYYFTMTAANSVAAAPATDLPSIDELMQPDEAAGETTTSPLIWIVPLAAVIGVMLIMIAINNARTRSRRRSASRRSYGSYDPYRRRK